MNRKLAATIVLGGVISAACDDTIPRPNPEPPTLWTVVPGVDTPGACACRTARQWFLVNKAKTTRTAVFTEIRNIVNGETFRDTRSLLDVPPLGGRKLLGCSPENTATTQCAVDFLWEIDGIVYHGRTVAALVADRRERDNEVARRQPIAALENAQLNALSHGERPVNVGNACVAKCSGNDSDCLRIDAREQKGNPAASMIALIHDAGADGRVDVAKMLAAVGESKNVCERSDFVIDNGSFSNTGIACNWRGGAPGNTVTLTIPEHLAGRVSSSGGKLSMTFSRPLGYGPKITFEDNDLNADFGGHVSRADEVTLSTPPSQYVVLTGPKNCVALRTG